MPALARNPRLGLASRRLAAIGGGSLAANLFALAFARLPPILANPDLPTRIRADLPLNVDDQTKCYGPGPPGYVDCPVAGTPV